MDPIHRSHPRLVGAVIIIGALAAVVSAFLMLRGDLGATDGVTLALGLPAESLYVITATSSIDPLPMRGAGALEDVAAVKGMRVGIIRTDGGGYEVFTLGLFGDTQVTNDGERKASIAVSPDGRFIAYAVLTDIEEANEPLLASWTVNVLDTNSGETAAIGSGYAPQFFVRDGATYLLFTTPGGVAIADPIELSAQVTMIEGLTDIRSSAAVSPDGAYMAVKQEEGGGYSLLSVTGTAPELSLQAVGGILDPLDSVAFYKGSLIGIARTPGTTMLKAYDPANPAEGADWRLLPQASVPYFLLP